MELWWEGLPLHLKHFPTLLSQPFYNQKQDSVKHDDHPCVPCCDLPLPAFVSFPPVFHFTSPCVFKPLFVFFQHICFTMQVLLLLCLLSVASSCFLLVFYLCLLLVSSCFLGLITFSTWIIPTLSPAFFRLAFCCLCFGFCGLQLYFVRARFLFSQLHASEYLAFGSHIIIVCGKLQNWSIANSNETPGIKINSLVNAAFWEKE